MCNKYQNVNRGLNSLSSFKWLGFTVATSVVAVALVAAFKRPKSA